MDVRCWSRELIIDLINLYKSLPCLWKVKSEEYKNRNMRNRAYEKLVQFCKARGFPEANKDFVAKKIQSLRGSFRKELRKVEDSERRGPDELHTPCLWYYNLLLFTKDQEVTSEDDLHCENTEVDRKCETYEMGEVDEYEEEVIQKPTVQPYETLCPKKRKLSESQTEIARPCTLPVMTNDRPTSSPSEFEAVGVNLSSKLARMDPLQAIFAESLVSDIIRRGLLNKLTERTDLCDNGCNKTH